GSGSFGNGLTFVQLFSKIRCIIVPHNGVVKGISAVDGAHSPRNHAPHQAPRAHPGNSQYGQNTFFFASVADEYPRPQRPLHGGTSGAATLSPSASLIASPGLCVIS